MRDASSSGPDEGANGGDALDDDGGGAAAEADADAGPTETFVSDLPFSAIENGWGPVEKNTSTGEEQPNDGKGMLIGGVAYAKGLGVHAASRVEVALGGAYKTFLAEVGVDDEVGDRGSVVFKVIVDGQEVYDSGVVTGAMLVKNVSVDVTGKQKLELVVTDGGDGLAFDHADWALARLQK